VCAGGEGGGKGQSGNGDGVSQAEAGVGQLMWIRHGAGFRHGWLYIEMTAGKV
jgi:hypothetical protein